MTVKLVFLGKLADLAGASHQDVPGPLDWKGLVEALPGPLGHAVEGDKIKLALNGTVITSSAVFAFASDSSRRATRISVSRRTTSTSSLSLVPK